MYECPEELVKFCHDNGLPASGGKQELTERIAYYLDTGKIKNSSGTASTKRKAKITTITEASKIEENIITINIKYKDEFEGIKYVFWCRRFKDR